MMMAIKHKWYTTTTLVAIDCIMLTDYAANRFKSGNTTGAISNPFTLSLLYWQFDNVKA